MLHQNFPSSLTLAWKVQSGNSETFQKLIVCQTCFTTYSYEDCFGANGISKCTYMHFPRHLQKQMRVVCGSPLLKTVKTAAGKQLSFPLKVFCFKALFKSIQFLFQQPGMLDLLSKWKHRMIPSGIMTDIYDGIVWKSF